MRLERRLVAVMFTDMVGYTALIQADEHAAVERRDRYWSALEGHHDAFGGTEAVEGRPETVVQIAAAAEVYAQQEGIAVIYSDENPGREYVDWAEAALSAEGVARAREVGRRLTIREALDLARLPGTASLRE